ncbi:MAG: hypothetical protein RSD79_05825 [Cetobacterium sp.]
MKVRYELPEKDEDLIVGEVYEVVSQGNNFLRIIVNGKEVLKSIWKFREVEEEESVKMGKINLKHITTGDRVATKEDLGTLCKGLKFEVGKILVDSENGERYLVPKEKTAISYISEKKVYKLPEKTTEEILEELFTNDSVFNKEKGIVWVVSHCIEDSRYFYCYDDDAWTMGTIYLKKEQAEEYVRLLNMAVERGM